MSRSVKYPFPILSIILLLSIGIRLAYYQQVKESPLMNHHLWQESDMNFFHVWGKELAAGDWLTNQVLHPYHDWHAAVASKETWDRWFGGKRFHQEPFYAYLVGIIYRFFGEQVRWVFFLQFLIGSINPLLIYAVTRRCFGNSAALIAACIGLLYAPLLFYESVLLRVTLIAFSTLLSVWLLGIALDRRRPIGFVLLGLVLGVGLLITSPTLILLLAVLIAIPFYFKEVGRRMGYVALLCLSSLVAFSPLIIRNVLVGVGPFETPSVASPTFIEGNVSGFIPGTGVYWTEHILPIMEKTGGRFGPVVLETLRTHPNFLSYFRQLAGKFFYFWHWYEIPNNINFYYYRLNSGLLAHLLTFSTVGPLSFIGLILAWRTLKKSWPLYAGVSTGILVDVLFHNLSRYRAPYITLLIPFAAYTLVLLVESVAAKRYKTLGIGAVATVFLAYFLFSPPNPKLGYPIGTVDYVVGNELSLSEAVKHYRSGDGRGALRRIRYALKTEPDEISRILSEPEKTPQDERYCILAYSFGEVYRVSSVLNRDFLQFDAANEHLDRAESLRKFCDVKKIRR